ncbi:hypothetical protein RU08_17335 [Pseudomonas fulva]|uniref:Uncharacterized protein n=2 Tax=Pseudomonas TaxID=286 RepID=A0A0D0KF57_9PSED|nr:hypothetical protein RU08_17335 [Pseudomonas fulva]
MQVFQNPDAYPDAENILNEFVAQAGASLRKNESAVIDEQGHTNLLNKAAPQTIDMADLSSDSNGYQEFIANGAGGYFFNGSGGYNKMIGGEGLNWFLIQEDWALEGWDFLTPQNIVIGGAGYNVLDFSGVQ